MDIQVEGKNLINLRSINVIIGKNGCGKSRILRQLDAQRDKWTQVKYISPERGGQTIYDPHIENNMQRSQSWLADTRRRNHDEHFRKISFVHLRSFETLINRKRSDVLRDKNLSAPPHFDELLNLINDLLDNVELIPGNNFTVEIRGKADKEIRKDEHLSSGEKELITLAIEILHFVYQIKNNLNESKQALLLLDEPDVHLHPDLQYKLINLLVKEVRNQPITMIISTHSTAILGALNKQNAHVCFMKKDSTELIFSAIDEQLMDIIPIFGAHPLSNIFSQSPILIVEGEDDERIWQQVVRSSEGKIKLWPCPAGTKDKLYTYETKTSELIESIYDGAKAYSFRDRDDDLYEIEDIRNVIRARLNCYGSENLILSNEVLARLETNWDEMQNKIRNWLDTTEPSTPKYEKMRNFSEKFDRQNHKVKDLRTVFIYLTGKDKPWEIVVGQAIAGLGSSLDTSEGSLVRFLGPKIISALNLSS